MSIRKFKPIQLARNSALTTARVSNDGIISIPRNECTLGSPRVRDHIHVTFGIPGTWTVERPEVEMMKGGSTLTYRIDVSHLSIVDLHDKDLTRAGFASSVLRQSTSSYLQTDTIGNSFVSATLSNARGVSLSSPKSSDNTITPKSRS